ncbi:OmpH family outer membrane protein [Yunchengibacter salinarum]|uniref:OmpH family outer membrane protein n=1 Tax=Yunchengibacter salinarum TaxID=3133399 RepID=UPI0035B670EE
MTSTVSTLLRLVAPVFMVGALVISSGAQAEDILIVDNARVEQEAAPYQDFNLQTNEIRQQIMQLRQLTSRGGRMEQRMADLEKSTSDEIEDLQKRKALIGDQKFAEERKKVEQQYSQQIQQLRQQYGQAQQTLRVLEMTFDRLRQDAMVQVERARQPVIRALLKEHDARVILPKRVVLGNASGMDVTTEFIERLNEQLPSVDVDVPDLSQAAQQSPEDAAEALEEVESGGGN